MRIVFVAAFAVGLLGWSVPVGADEIYVPGDATTVAGGLALATSGDRVYVGEGLFTENLTVPAGVGLFGSGHEVSILDGGGVGTVVDSGGDGVVVSGFSIRNAGGTYPGLGVTVYDVDTTICNNFIYWNFRGVWVDGESDTTVRHNISADNEDD
ncbi:MAG: hypothetical protein JRF63_07340, partial [Deltaproteobacteria bacterium]|nr:hypothetical protein [Deltaproteobacteria bacterium]